MDFILDFKDLLLLFSASLAFLIAFSFFFRSKSANTAATTFLILFLTVIFFRILIRFFDEDGRFERYYMVFEFNRVLGLFTPPLFFLYVLYYLKNIRKLKNKSLWHLVVPGVVFFCYVILLILPTTFFNHPFLLSWYNVFALIYSFYYLIASLKVYLDFRQKIKEKDALTQPAHLQVLGWIRLLIIIYFTFLIFAILPIFLDSDFIRDLPFQILSILIPLVGIKLFTMVDFIAQDPVPKKKYGGNKLKKSVSNNLGAQLEKVVWEKELFRHPDITILEVAEALEVSEQEISQYLNSEVDSSFNRFINKQRVKYAKILLKNPKLTEKITIEHLGYEAGFNSKTTFFNSFKKEEGITPGNFKKEQFTSKVSSHKQNLN